MDVRNWKNILLQWIGECAFHERNYFNIEQTDIDEFFNNLREKHEKISSDKHMTLKEFLEQFYPNFEIHLDDNNCLSSVEYIYVYSLLLHFCCVKFPQTIFHEICQKLPESSQQSIVMFFRELMAVQTLDKESLRHAIAQVAASHVSPLSITESLTNSSDSMTSTPVKRCLTVPRTNIITPKSHLLEERTRELFKLRAQLDTERYEKSLLEIQIKQNEDKIVKLNQDHKKLLQQIHDLKSDILFKTSESVDPPEQAKDDHKHLKRLLRELHQKEKENAQLNDVLRTVQEEKKIVEEKWDYSKKQIVECLARIEELDLKINDLTEELEKKGNTIKYLEDNKRELQQYIDETRAASNSRRELNISTDILDASFARSCNSSGTTNTSPENLAASVIDKQFREKEYECQQLYEELTVLRSNNKLLGEHLKELIKVECDEFNIDLKELPEEITSATDMDLSDDPITQFNIFASCMERIHALHTFEKLKLHKLEQQMALTEKEKSDLAYKLNKILDDANTLKDNLNAADFRNKELYVAKKDVEKDLNLCEQELEHLKTKFDCTNNELKSVRNEKDSLAKEVQKLKDELKQLPSTQLHELEQQIHCLKRKLHTLQDTSSVEQESLKKELIAVKDELTQKANDLKAHQEADLNLKNKYEQLLVQNEHLKDMNREADVHLANIKTELKEKEQEMVALGTEMSTLTVKNADLEKNMQLLTQKFTAERYKNEIYKSKCSEDDSRLKLQEGLGQSKTSLEVQDLDVAKLRLQIEQLQPRVSNLLRSFTESSSPERVSENLDLLEYHVKALLEQNANAMARLETLEIAQSESITRIEQLLKEVAEKDRQLSRQSICYEELLILRGQVSEYEQSIADLKDKELQLIDHTKTDLLRKEVELKNKLDASTAEYEIKLDELLKELKIEKASHSDKERELLLVLTEHNDIKCKLNETEKELKALREANATLKDSQQRLLGIEVKLVATTTENNLLRQEIELFKQDAVKHADRLQEADKILNTVTLQNKSVEELEVKVSDMQAMLEKEAQVKETLLHEVERQKNNNINYSQQIEKFKAELNAQIESLNSLNDELAKVKSEKERLLIEATEFDKVLQCEREEKSLLLQSLEQSADQLKLVANERDHQTDDLQRSQLRLEELQQQNIKLLGHLAEREAELRLCLEEQQQDQDDFQTKVSNLMRKMAQQSENLETHDLAIVEITGVLENNIKCSIEEQQDSGEQIPDLFSVSIDQHCHSNIIQLRRWLNRLVHYHFKSQEALNRMREDRGRLQQENQKLTCAEKEKEHKVECLQQKLSNVEMVNEGFSIEIDSMQALLSVKEHQLSEATIKLSEMEQKYQQLKTKEEQFEKLKEDHKKVQLTSEKALEKIDTLEKLSHEKQSKVEALEKEVQEMKDKANKAQNKHHHVQQQNTNLLSENKRLSEKFKQLEIRVDSLEVELSQKNKELSSVKSNASHLQKQRKDLEEQISEMTKSLEETVNEKSNMEKRCGKLRSECDQLQRDIEFAKTQHQNALDENTRLSNDIQCLRSDKALLRNEIKDLKLDLQQANDNVSQLILQIGSIRSEKEAAVEESQSLRKQMEENTKNYIDWEKKLKSLEEKLTTTESDLKIAKTNSEESEKLLAENQKLRENNEAITKRVERMALKLGDTQARSIKLEKDNEKLAKTLETNAATVESLQREKDSLQAEAKSLKERLSKAERAHEQLAGKVQNLEHLNQALQEVKRSLEASEIDAKSKLNKLEKMREANDEKLRKLNTALSNSESANVKLNLEIGALNSQLQKINAAQVEQLTKNLKSTTEQSEHYKDLVEKLKTEIDTLREQNTEVSDQLSKTSLSLDIAKEKCDKLMCEMEQLRADMLILRQEKIQAEQKHEILQQKFQETQSESEQMLCERQTEIKALESRRSELEESLVEKTKNIAHLERQLKAEAEKLQLTTTDSPPTATPEELEDLQRRLTRVDEQLEKEKQLNAQLMQDNQILHNKYQQSKQRVRELTVSNEERIKENRLEWENKLEKMKDKMKKLFTEETSKIKSKHDGELATLKMEMEQLKTQNQKYEEHTRKLSAQIVRLNDKILEHQKEKTLLVTKLKHLTEEEQSEKFKRPSSIHVSATSTNLGSNLAMEDEEGEIFNNTYLTDLKTGRMSAYMNRDVCAEELKYRNSLQPRHLKCSYAAQFDHELPEDNLKESRNSFDDSMSALLSTTGCGTRKKSLGITHYKRPGPPTPSKNGARLSFGGCINIGEPPREILKESLGDNNAGVPTAITKTPARFNFFSSRFSIGVRDEKSEKHSSEDNLRKDWQKRNVQNEQKSAAKGSIGGGNIGGVCTSTPRKSKVHFDQRRLLDQLMSSSTSPSPLILKAVTLNITSKQSSRYKAMKSGRLRRQSNTSRIKRRLSRHLQKIYTPSSTETTSSAPGSKKTPIKQRIGCKNTSSSELKEVPALQKYVNRCLKRERCVRPSIHVTGNIFAKYRPTDRGNTPEFQRHKKRKQRFEQFNRGRNLNITTTQDLTATRNNATYDAKAYLTNQTIVKINNQVLNKIHVLNKTQKHIAATNIYGNENDPDNYFDGSEENGTEAEDDEDIFIDNNCGNTFDCSPDLVTSRELEAFDHFIQQQQQRLSIEPIHEQQHEHRIRFEQLIRETASTTPFQVNAEIRIQHTDATFDFHKHNSGTNDNLLIEEDDDRGSLSTATPHYDNSSLLFWNKSSRTIYGNSLIHRHRLPHINTTFNRKSSIHVPKHHRRSTKSYKCLFNVNQTPTLLDLTQMWTQMNTSTRLLVCFVVIASCSTLIGLFMTLFSER